MTGNGVNSTVIYQPSYTSENGALTAVGNGCTIARVEWVRVSQDRDSSPSVASVDSQMVPMAVMVGDTVGYDAGKKLKGRKQFTLVDTLGLLLMVKVVAANVQERDGAKQLLT